MAARAEGTRDFSIPTTWNLARVKICKYRTATWFLRVSKSLTTTENTSKLNPSVRVNVSDRNNCNCQNYWNNLLSTKCGKITSNWKLCVHYDRWKRTTDRLKPCPELFSSHTAATISRKWNTKVGIFCIDSFTNRIRINNSICSIYLFYTLIC